MASQTASLDSNKKQPFPFMKLPPELRLVIYEHALQAAIPTSCARGALALLLTNKEVRAESGRAMMPSILDHLESHKTRVEFVERKWDELQRRRLDDEDEDDHIFPTMQQLSGLEDTTREAHFLMQLVSSMHLAVSRAAKDSLPQLNDQHSLQESLESRSGGRKSRPIMLLRPRYLLAHET